VKTIPSHEPQVAHERQQNDVHPQQNGVQQNGVQQNGVQELNG